MLDATRRFAEPLTLERLLEWHRWLFPDQESDFTARSMHVGALRGDEPMQVVSGRLDRPTVHFEAPPRQGLERQLDRFLAWFEASQHQTALDPLLRAGIAHFWFVTLHPFDDGNGRLTRTITDLALAQGEAQAIRFYAMSASILDDRSGYYRVLEASQKPHWMSPSGSRGFCRRFYAVCSKPSRGSKVCWVKPGFGRRTVNPSFWWSRSKYSIVCSTVESAGSNTVSARRSIRRLPRSPKPRRRDIWRNCWKRVVCSECPEADGARDTKSPTGQFLQLNRCPIGEGLRKPRSFAHKPPIC